MTSQVNYVCWSSDVVSSTIPTEAATPSNEVLLATHAPLRITRRGGHGGHQASELVSEHQVLSEFLSSRPNNGVLIATVLGESGAGKSHLVRWANAKINRQPGRHVVYLQKTETSLKDVVEALLVGQTDPEFEEIRHKVSSLGTGMTLDEMEHKLLSELAEALRTAQADTPYGRALVGDDGLRLFFTDPLFEKHLLREGSFIRRRAEHALRGRDADEGDIPLEFTAEELPLDIADYANIQEAAHATQKLFRRLLPSHAMQAEAVRMINENLDIAVMKAASLAVGDIGQAFKKIREKLVGEEIVLLIEDIALIQGVRRDLLDAVIEVGVVQGVERLATVRTLLAVTPGYYRDSLPETFRRRSEATSPIYAVDVDLDSTTADENDLIDFVGRYLNAARVGKEKLEDEAPHVPNACNACQFQSSCHATFGASRQEYGLYPYNRVAVLRAIRACAERVTGRDHAYFNPRKVLSRAVRNVLNDNISVIRRGAFPPSNFLAEESTEMGLGRLPTHVREQIEIAFAGDDAGRVDALLTFWGGMGTEPVSNEILASFAHPAVPAALYGSDHSQADDRAEKVPERSADELPRSLLAQLDAIEAWSQGKALTQSVAADMRSIIRESLLARIDWYDVVIKDPDGASINRAIPNNARSVSIEGAIENLPLGTEPLLRLERSARMAVTFKGLSLLRAGFPERASDALTRVDALVAPCIAQAKRRIVAELDVTDEALVDAAASLIRGAVACGVVPTRPTDIDFVAACLWRDSSPRVDNASRSLEWIRAYQEYVAAREPAIERLLSGLGAAQGAGAVHAIDFSRFATITETARKLALGESEIIAPSWCKDADRKLKALTRLAARQVAHWQGLLDRVRVHIPVDGSLSDSIEAIGSAVREGQAQGLVRVADLHALAARNEAARSLDARCIDEIEEALVASSGKSGIELDGTVGRLAGADIQAVVDYVEFSAQWIEAGIAQAERSGGAPANADEMLEAAIGNWFEIVGEVKPGE